MTIPGISSTDPTALISDPTASANMDENAFLDLLVTQLQNQDPLEPMQNEDFVAQLATFSSLEELETLNQSVIAMIGLQQSNALLSQLTGSSGLIGQSVTYLDPATGTEMSGTVDAVKVENGFPTLSIGGQDIPLDLLTEINGAPSA